MNRKEKWLARREICREQGRCHCAFVGAYESCVLREMEYIESFGKVMQVPIMRHLHDCCAEECDEI